MKEVEIAKNNLFYTCLCGVFEKSEIIWEFQSIFVIEEMCHLVH